MNLMLKKLDLIIQLNVGNMHLKEIAYKIDKWHHIGWYVASGQIIEFKKKANDNQ